MPIASVGQTMSQRRLESLEELILASLNPKAFREEVGLPHPLAKFSANGAVKESLYADAIIEFIKDWTCEAPESVKRRAAKWFLFESEKAFFVACFEAGIDAEKLRSHLALLTS